MLHPVPPVPELRTRSGKLIERWRIGPGRRPFVVFVLAAFLSLFAQTIAWMYSLNVFCMSGDDQSCTDRLDWSTWTVSTFLFYVNAWSLASWITDRRERRRLKSTAVAFDTRLAAFSGDAVQDRIAVVSELRERATARDADAQKVAFQVRILNWFRVFFIVGSFIPLLFILHFIVRLMTAPIIVAIVASQVWILLRLTKVQRRMKHAAQRLGAEWEDEFTRFRSDMSTGLRRLESLTFRPWSRQRRTTDPAPETNPPSTS